MLLFMLDSVCILVALSDIICTNDVTNKLCQVSNEVTLCGCQYLAVFIMKYNVNTSVLIPGAASV